MAGNGPLQRLRADVNYALDSFAGYGVQLLHNAIGGFMRRGDLGPAVHHLETVIDSMWGELSALFGLNLPNMSPFRPNLARLGFDGFLVHEMGSHVRSVMNHLDHISIRELPNIKASVMDMIAMIEDIDLEERVFQEQE